MEILWNLILERVKKGKEKKKEKKLGGRAVRSVIEQDNVTHPFLSRFSEIVVLRTGAQNKPARIEFSTDLMQTLYRQRRSSN